MSETGTGIPKGLDVIERAVWQQLRLYADVAHDSNPLDAYLDELAAARKRGDLVEIEKLVHALARRLAAMKTVEEREGVPWPVPEELERPGWRFEEAEPGSWRFEISHDVGPGMASFAEYSPGNQPEHETEVVGQYVPLRIHLAELPEPLELQVGWSVRSRVVVLWGLRAW